ncbi:uncharacterized protein LOC144145046 isoform X1 [Haemaphysalis longicornis]
MDGVVTVQPPRSTSDPMLAVGDCLQSSRSPKKFDQPHRTSSLVVSTTQSPYHRGYPDTATDEAADTHPDGNDSPLLGCEDTFVHDEKAHFEKGAHRGEPLGVDSPGTSSSCESVELPTGWSQREYVLRAQAVFETYWKSNVHNVLEVLKELSERGVAELGWKRQGKLQEFTKTVSRVWQRVGEQVTGLTGEMLPHLDAQSASSRPEFMAHELLPLLMRICEVWWLTQRQVASHFIALHQKYDNSSEHWLMALREVDIHLLRTSILHREIMASELRKLVKAADRELEASGCTLHAIFLKEGIGHWLAENLDLIWCEFGNQVQKGVVSLYKAFDTSFVRGWASSVDANADQVAHRICDAWKSFIGRAQDSRRIVVEAETTQSVRQDDNEPEIIMVPKRIYVYTRILRSFEEVAFDEWQETYRATIDILDQALGTSTTEDGSASVGSEIGGALSTGSLTQSAPASHTKVTVMVTKIWEGVMSEMRQCFKECRARFEEAILTDHRL